MKFALRLQPIDRAVVRETVRFVGGKEMGWVIRRVKPRLKPGSCGIWLGFRS